VPYLSVTVLLEYGRDSVSLLFLLLVKCLGLPKKFVSKVSGPSDHSRGNDQDDKKSKKHDSSKVNPQSPG
jgi:hypothetical protein